MSLGIDLSTKYLYIIDIRFKQKKINLSKYINSKTENKFLSLTPYSSYLLDLLKNRYITYHDIVSEKVFRDKVLEDYHILEKDIFYNLDNYKFLMRNIAFIKTMEVYLEYLFDYLNKKKLDNYSIIYITDIKPFDNKELIYYSFIYDFNIFDKIYFLDRKDSLFYKVNIIKNNFLNFIKKKNKIKKIYNRYIKKNRLSYDNSNFAYFYNKNNSFKISRDINSNDISLLVNNIHRKLVSNCQFFSLKNKYIDICNNVKSFDTNKVTLEFSPFTFISKYIDYNRYLLYKENKIPIIFMQHGSYIHENYFLKFNEIYPADINFVFNDYTRKKFLEKKNANKIYSIGSSLFNYEVSEKKSYKYDFLYIIYCTSYSYTGTYIGSENNLLSIDGDNIFHRHKEVIQLFGNKFKNKNICIKIQPSIFLGKMLYIPFLEISKNYKNIHIEYTIPISELILYSKYIISDYFSSDFINREIHYKKDIIVFNDKIIPFSKEIVLDMHKMFILVKSVRDLEDIIVNIEKIIMNRKRYDKIIEYYSSKKCNTKKIVKNILEKELDDRR